MTTRIPSLLLKSACVAAVLFGMSAPSSACWFPFCWHGYSAYRPAYPAYYGPTYGQGCCAPGCSPCGPGGCGIQTYYGPTTACSACGCAPCGCAPCGVGCGDGCGVNVGYATGTDPVPDDGADSGEQRTYAPEDGATGMPEEPPRPVPGDDDFEPAEREESESTEGEDPFPDFERPVQQPSEPGDAAVEDPQPLNLDNRGVTLRVMPTRQRVRAEARYRVPRIARLEVAPGETWLPVRELPAHVASK